MLASAVTESLVRRDRDGSFVPRLAVEVPTLANGRLRVETEDDGGERLVAIYEIRDTARWQDGTPVGAEDVRFALEIDRQAPPGTERRWRADRIERVEVVAERIARVVYRGGERWPLYALAPRVLPAHLLRQASPEALAAYERAPVHAGPFAVAAWVRGYGVTLTAFQGYVGGAPRLGRIEVRFYRDTVALGDALFRGDVDVVPSPAFDVDMIPTLERRADGKRLLAHFTPAMSVTMLHFGTRGVLADPVVRRALYAAIDRVRIVETLFGGRVRVPRSFLVAPNQSARDVLPAPRSDRDAAAALLASAGFVRGGLGILERDGERLVIDLLVSAGSRARLATARAIAEELAPLGIAVTVRERATADVEAAVTRAEFELALLVEPGDDEQRASWRWLGRADGWYDLLLEVAARATGTDRGAAYADLQRAWSETTPGLPMYQELRVDVAPRALDGVQPPPHGDPLTWNVAEWTFAPTVN